LRRRAFLVQTLLLGLSGCTLGRSGVVALAYYDLGMASVSRVGVRLPSSLALDELAAGPWLQTQAILYRLTYRDPAQLHAYAHSRWSAPPALLLTQRLRLALTASAPQGVSMLSDGVAAAQILKADLETFEQRVHSPTASEAIVMMRASLIDGSSRRLQAQRMLTAVAPCPSVDAEGAAHALRDATDGLVAELIEWLAKEAHAAAMPR
jgi:cholesterol transport system auxiliary component